MRHYANLVKNNQGVTLIELLTALVISALVLGIAYGLLMAGYKTYEKVGIEQGLRDEGDYVVSRIMQTFYDGDISNIKNCDPTPSTLPGTDKNICINIYKTVASKIATGSNSKVGIASFNELKNNLTVTQIKIIEETIDGKKVNNVVIDEYEAEKVNDKINISNFISSEKINTGKYDFYIAPKMSTETGSEINATCSYEAAIITDQTTTIRNKFINKKCSNGIVDVSLIVKRANVSNDKYKLELKSQFGF
ncbi:PilW family protein [Schinkia sp. CFF1]